MLSSSSCVSAPCVTATALSGPVDSMATTAGALPCTIRVMRLVGVLGCILCAPVFAQELDINGYSKVVVPRSQGTWFNENAALREALRGAGFEVHRSVDEIPREARSTALWMTVRVAELLSYYIFVFDVATNTGIAYCTLGDADVRVTHVPGRPSAGR